MEPPSIEATEKRSRFNWTWSKIAKESAKLALVILAGIVLGSAASDPRVASLFHHRRPIRFGEPAPPAEPVSLIGAQLEGDERARLAVIEFSDFECPVCGTFAISILPEFRAKFVKTGLVLLAFRDLPLTRIHPSALAAAQAAGCAGRQDRFWPMHDLLFAHRAQVADPQAPRKWAEQLGLNVTAFQHCLDQPENSAAILEGAADARKLGVINTPTFFIGWLLHDRTVRVVRRLSGAAPITVFQLAFDQLPGKPN